MKKAQQSFLLAFLLVAVLPFSACRSNPKMSPTQSPTPAERTAAGATSKPTPSPTEGGKNLQWSSPPPMTIDPGRQYSATIKTNFGDIVVQLFPKDAPLAVNNFVFLARQGFYDGVKFHRVMKGFVIQSGDPTGTGTGGPGYKFADEQVQGEYGVGAVAMANSGPDTNGSQFFICIDDCTRKLSKDYNLFGFVVDGVEIAQAIAVGDVMATVVVEERER